jgi:hypothetical protein
MSTERKQFPFRKPNGDVVWVDFARMMEAELGELRLDDGTVAVRARDLEDNAVAPAEQTELRAECISDSLGFPEKNVAEHQRFLKEAGIKGIEFRRDPTCPGFMQVVCDSQAAKLRYAKARGFEDKNSHNGGSAAIGPHEIEQARELVQRKHGSDNNLVVPEESNV